MARQHVGEETDGEADQAHELAKDLERDDERVEGLRHLGDPALEVLHGPVRADSLVVREDERHQREGERHGQRRGGGEAPEGRGARRRGIVNFSSDSGSGMNPSMLTTQMKIISVAQYGNHRLIEWCGSPCSATCVCAMS